LVLPSGLGFEFGENRRGLGLGVDAPLLGFGLGFDDGLGFLGLGGSFELGAALGLDALGIGDGGAGHRPVLGFEHGRFGLALLRFGNLISLGLADRQLGLRSGHLGLRMGLAGERLGVGVGHRDPFGP